MFKIEPANTNGNSPYEKKPRHTGVWIETKNGLQYTANPERADEQGYKIVSFGG